MNSSRRLVLIIFIVLVVVIGGLSYYHSYVTSHSHSLIVINVSARDISVDGYGTLNITLAAEINSTNSLTNFSLQEVAYVEGLDIVFAGDNYSQAVNISTSAVVPNSSIPQLYGFNHFILDNGHPVARLNWNLSVYNFTSGLYMKAPSGYYYFKASFVSSNGDNIRVKLPNDLVYVENKTAKIVPNAG